MSSQTTLPLEPPSIDYAARWQTLVERRRLQMDAANAAAGIDHRDYWARRAKQYRASLHERMDEDPFLRAVLARVTAHSSILDVGAGTGRHTLALAPHVARVTAVDPSAAMLALLLDDLQQSGIANVEAVEAEWMHAGAAPHDVVICSHVLYPIADVIPFVRKLEAAARERVMIYLRVDPLATDLGLWREFHGAPLQGQPVFTDLLPLLWQAGIVPDVAVVEHRFTWTFKDMQEATAQVRTALCLREDDAAAITRLRALLDERLVQSDNGRLGPAIESARSAIISWEPPPP
jgi:SAM-dependent methyltransferase